MPLEDLLDGGFAISSTLLVYVLGCAGGLIIGSLVGAIWLRAAASLLRLEPISYFRAFISALTANFVVFVINLSISFNHFLTVVLISAYVSDRPSRVSMASFYSPIYFLYMTMIALTVIAAIFGRTIPKDADSRIRFSDALALASLYSAISFAFLVVMVIVVYCIISGVLALLGP